VVADDSTSRRRVDRHAPMLATAYPIRGRAAWALAAAPHASARALVFLSATSPGGIRGGPVTRVRPTAASTGSPSAVPNSARVSGRAGRGA
jgi:hypothetical protein